MDDGTTTYFEHCELRVCIHLSKAASSDGRIPHEPIYSSLCCDTIKRISNQTDSLVGLFLQSLSYLYMYYLRH